MSKIRSMTGYGQASIEGNGVRVEVEVRAVNSRYLDVNQRLPSEYQFFEGVLRGLVAAAVPRGRIDLTVLRLELGSRDRITVRFQKNIYRELLGVYKSCCGDAMTEPQVLGACVRDILARPEVLDLRRSVVEPRKEATLVKQVVKVALQKLQETSLAEGERLGRDIEKRFGLVQELANSLSNLARRQRTVIQTRLSERISRLEPKPSVDAARLAAEVVFLVDKADVTEELVRMHAHLDACRELLRGSKKAPGTPGEIGKRLEFLLQELQREFSTTAAKSQLAPMQHAVVAAKAELEKIREQIQNIV